MPRHRSRLRKLAFGSGFTLLALAVLEGLAALTVGRPGSSGEVVGYGGFRNLLVEVGGFVDAARLLEPDSELLWKPRAGVRDLAWHPPLWIDNRTNRHGYRDPERCDPVSTEALRILCLGDSCTWGTGVRVADSYPQLLESMLARAYHDRVVEVWNGGVPGWSSDQGVTRLERDGPWLRPTVVIVAFGINDARHWDLARHHERGHGLCRSDREVRARLSAPLSRARRILDRFALGRLLARALPDRVQEPDPSDQGGVRVPDRDYRENLRAMAAQARALGAAPFFVVWPIRWQIEPAEGRDLDPATSYQVAMLEVAGELGVPVLDLVEEFRDARELFVDSVHMNEAGCRRVATAIGERLHGLGMLPELPEETPR